MRLAIRYASTLAARWVRESGVVCDARRAVFIVSARRARVREKATAMVRLERRAAATSLFVVVLVVTHVHTAVKVMRRCERTLLGCEMRGERVLSRFSVGGLMEMK